MDERKIKQDILSALVFLAGSIFLAVYAIPTQIAVSGRFMAAADSTGSRIFPYFAAAVMGLSAIVEIVTKLFQLRRAVKPEAGETKKDWKNERKAIVIFLLCCVYAVLFERIGYLISTAVVMPAALFVMGSRKWQHYVSVYVVGIVMYVTFRYVLNVPLP